MSGVKRQRPTGEPRRRIASSVIKAIERVIQREMRRYGVSRSFVVATALAYTFGIEEQENYQTCRGSDGARSAGKRKNAHRQSKGKSYQLRSLNGNAGAVGRPH